MKPRNSLAPITTSVQPVNWRESLLSPVRQLGSLMSPSAKDDTMSN